MTSFYQCSPIFIIFGTQYTELICNITIIYLPTSPTYCCYTSMGNTGCSSKGLTGQSYAQKLMPYLCQDAQASFFVTPGTEIDGCYYRDVVLMQQMLQSIRSIAGDAYIFQQNSAPVHLHVRWLSSLSMKLQNSLLQTYGP